MKKRYCQCQDPRCGRELPPRAPISQKFYAEACRSRAYRARKRMREQAAVAAPAVAVLMTLQQQRQEAGLPALQPHEDLELAAQAQATAMATAVQPPPFVQVETLKARVTSAQLGTPPKHEDLNDPRLTHVGLAVVPCGPGEHAVAILLGGGPLADPR